MRWFALFALLTGLLLGSTAHAAPSPVMIGSYVKEVRDLDFRANKYTIDFFVWFRWRPTEGLKDYKPLESLELVNGKIEDRSSVVEKVVNGEHYASTRIVATINEPWDLVKFPFDRHRIKIAIEDANLGADDMVFVADQPNSRLGDEMAIAGWLASNFATQVSTMTYHSNYGDPSLSTDARSAFSRFSFALDLDRQTFGSALKLLSTVLLATAVAFVAFMVKPSDLDARFGMGVGSLFAVAASAFVAAGSVPDSGVMTLADHMHMVALAFIFASLMISAVALKYEVNGREQLALKIDRIVLVAMPLLFYGWSAWAVLNAMH
ncbi:hypothetical protein KAK06_21740 [Ideonella sp. 4Y11]|uniref:Neurotransmitter-gated ion-channel ligand-binding domain-containing protein n=1 Tax=Ideonella aquatica TaxID=2824119 RepID=A0A940YMZ8_9BURK|nr:hypothetical protein [Ideonella aquatica]MBQ0961577.1 hypothetical protein [Ideonella aquatica]